MNHVTKHSTPQAPHYTVPATCVALWPGQQPTYRHFAISGLISAPHHLIHPLQCTKPELGGSPAHEYRRAHIFCACSQMYSGPWFWWDRSPGFLLSTNGSESSFSALATPRTQFLFCFVSVSLLILFELELTWQSLLNHGFLAKIQTELLAEHCYSQPEL